MSDSLISDIEIAEIESQILPTSFTVSSKNGETDKKQVCQKCNAKFSTFIEYYGHMQKCLYGPTSALNYSQKKRSCHRCGQQFRFYYTYRKHSLMCWRNSKNRNIMSTNLTTADLMPLQQSVNGSERETQNDAGGSLAETKSHWMHKKCEKCGTTFRGSMHQRIHMQSKTFCRTPPFVCKKCNRVFSSVHNLVKHERRKTNCVQTSAKPSFQCLKCGMIFEFYSLYERHVTRTKSCNTQLLEKNKTIDSIQVSPADYEPKKPEPKLKCRCGKLFRFRSRLERHLNRKVPCTSVQTDVVSIRKPTSDLHMRPTAFQGILTAEVSNEANRKDVRGLDVIKSSMNLMHRRPESIRRKIIKKYQIISTKSGEKATKVKPNLWCEICEKYFCSSYNVFRHMKERHGILRPKNESSFRCPRCPKTFATQQTLLIHQKQLSHWKNPYSTRIRECFCPFCDKKFLYLGSRNNHLKLHAASKPRECQYFLDSTTCKHCSKAFVTAEEKQAHQEAAHKSLRDTKQLIQERQAFLKEKPKEKAGAAPSPYRKTIINSSFSTDKPLQCPICHKVFCNPYARNRHLVGHTDEKPFVCQYCHERFQRNEHLTRHLQENHSNSLGFKCRRCGLKFQSRIQIIHHITKRHRTFSASSLIHEVRNNAPPATALEQNGRRKFTNIISSSVSEKRRVDKTPIKSSEEISMKTSEKLPVSTTSLKKSPEKCISDSHRKKQTYRCNICKDSSFTKLSNLNRHYKSKQHRENALSSTSTMKQPGAQVQQSCIAQQSESCSVSDSDSKLYHCNVCSINFSSISAFVPHRLSHFHLQNVNPTEISESNPYSCEICSRVFGHHQKVQTHLLWHLRADKAAQTSSGTVPQISRASQREFISISFNLQNTAEGEKLEVKHEVRDTVARKSLGSPTKAIKVASEDDFAELSVGNGQSDSCANDVDESSNKVCPGNMLKFVCKCKRYFPNRKSYRTHLRRCIECKKKSLKCSHCSLVFGSSNDMHYHEKSCLKVRGAEEECIGMSDENRFDSVLFENENCMSDDEKFKLSDNETSTNLESTVSQDSPLQIGKKMSEEHKGDKESSDSESISKWTSFKGVLFETTDLESDKLFKCLHCEETSSEFLTLINHMAMHFPFQCSDCSADITSLLELQNHPCLQEKSVTDGSGETAKSPTKVSPKVDKQVVQNEHAGNHDDDDASIADLASNLQVFHCALKAEEMAETLSSLRKNFSHLLFLLVADPELMTKLGWGEKLIDTVLRDVLLHMGQKPFHIEPELECLRKNISLLLQVCIKDQIMDAVGSKEECVDKVVKELLAQCCTGLDLPHIE